jgi:hypothetical protein
MGPALVFSLCVAIVPLRRPCSLACCSHDCPLPLALSQPPRLLRHASEALPCPACRPALSLRLAALPRLAYLRRHLPGRSSLP